MRDGEEQEAAHVGGDGTAHVHRADASGSAFDARGSALRAHSGADVGVASYPERRDDTCRHQEAHVRHLRFYMACMELLATPATAHMAPDALHLAQEELAAFHRLVTHRVTHAAVMSHARASVQAAMAPLAVPTDSEHPTPEAIRAACYADLQLVVPRVWLGSTVRRPPSDRYVIRCVSTFLWASAHELQLERAVKGEEEAVHVLELPRLAVETAMETPQGREELMQRSQVACERLQRVAAGLNALLGHGDVVLCCESGVTTSVGVCAALIMTRFALPLADALALLRCARRDVQPSTHLLFLLRLLERRLGRSDQ